MRGRSQSGPEDAAVLVRLRECLGPGCAGAHSGEDRLASPI
jgi:hypothetical protein